MSFDATRSVWAARASGFLDGGPRLLVALAMADRARQGTGEFQAGTRGLSAVCGVSQGTVTAAQRDLLKAGAVECTERGLGTRPSRWRWKLMPPPPATALPHVGDNSGQRVMSGAQGRGLARQNAALARHIESGSASPRKRNQDQGVNQCENGRAHDLTEPAEIPEHVATLRDAMGGRPAVPDNGGRP